jgi:predicted ABC-type ATPase
VPEVVIIAGPNGAGKTTFASDYLAAEETDFEFVNADEIARGLEGSASPAASDVQAARLMLSRIAELVEAGVDFAIETTLANLTYAQKIPLWRSRGYQVTLIYLWLPSIEASLARVRHRVEAGGHDIPEETIRRRFGKARVYFETIYKPIVDVWYLYESHEGGFALLDSWKRP